MGREEGLRLEPLHGIAGLLKARLDEHTLAMVDRIQQQIPEFQGRADVTPQTIDSTRSLVSAFARMVLRDLEPAEVQMPAEAIEYVWGFVRRGFDLKLLLRTYRLGHSELWRLGSDLIEAEAPEDAPELQRLLSLALFAFIDVVSDRAVDEYNAERKRWVRSAVAVRAQTVQGIFDEAPMDLEDASRRLRYRLEGRHVALSVWGDPRDDLHPLRTPLAESVERWVAGLGPSSLVVPAGKHVVWAWLALSDDTASLEGARHPDPSVRVAVGEPAPGIDGFRESHRQAEAARRLVTLAGRPPEAAVFWADVAPLGLLSADVGQARQFVSHELGALDAEDAASRRLRETLLAYLQEGDRPRAAQRLGVHVNTVAYRLRQAQARLPRPMDGRRFELQAALRLRDSMGLSMSMPPPRTDHRHD